MPYIPEEVSRQEVVSADRLYPQNEKTRTVKKTGARFRWVRSRNKKKNNVIIIIAGEEAGEIMEELLLAVKKMARRKELGFYITPSDKVSLETVQEFADFSLQVSAVNRG